MTVYTKQGARFPPARFSLIALSGGVWVTPFKNGATYTDPFDASVWTWGDMISVTDEVLGITQNGKPLTPVLSYADCLALEGSFFYDDANGLLYVLFFNYDYPTSADTPLTAFYTIQAGYASAYNSASKNVFDGVYYKGLITQISGFTKKADPLKLGLIAFDASSVSVSDQANDLFTLSAAAAVGVPLWAYYVDDDATALTDNDRIFTAYLNGYSHNRDALTYQLQEVRLFENKPICPNVLKSTLYPNAGDNKDKIIPVAFGDIRRGVMLLTNSGALTDASGTAVFLIADASLYAVRAITSIQDKNGTAQTITVTNLTACSVSVTKPAGVSPGDLSEWTWAGQGYDIDGDYNNGLDIIKAAFGKLANTPFLNSTFDVATWTAETVKNPEPVGLSVASDKGFIEELVQPLCTSLQGVAEILGDGRVSFASRDIFAPVTYTIPAGDQTDEPAIKDAPDSVISELLIEYSPDFRAKTALNYLYSAEKNSVVLLYGINRREPISPLKTLLTTVADAENLALEVMATSKQPERVIEVTCRGFIKNPRLFSIFKVDTGTYKNPVYEYGELLGIAPDLINKSQTFTIRVIPGYSGASDALIYSGNVYSDGVELLTNEYSDGTASIFTPYQITGEI